MPVNKKAPERWQGDPRAYLKETITKIHLSHIVVNSVGPIGAIYG